MSQNLAIRRAIEKQITECVIDTLLAAGYTVRVRADGPGFEPATTRDELLATCMDLDEAHLIVEREETTAADPELKIEPRKVRRMVVLVYGNDGYDLVADYSASLEATLAPVHALADAIEEGRFKVTPFLCRRPS